MLTGLSSFACPLATSVYAKLQWAAEKAGKSMHRIALEAVRQAVEREVRKHLG
jgi:predicted transcriptional regulator